KVPLVILLSPPEVQGGRDLGDDRFPEAAAPLQVLLESLRGGLLLRSVIEHDRAVLAPEIRALPVRRRRIVVLPKYFQKLVISNLPGIVFHLDDFCMPGFVGTDVLVSRV